MHAGRARRPLRPALRVERFSLAVVAVCAVGLATVPAPLATAATSVSGVVNTYQAVSSLSGSTVTVTGSTTGASGSFRTGDQVLVIQMTGANPAAGPSGLGNYERASVAAVSGSSIRLGAALTRSFTPATERVQLVRVVTDPGLTTVTGTVTALPWNGTTGGVVAMTGGTLSLGSRAIDVTGDGFTNLNPPYGRSIGGNSVAAGSTTGRGADGPNGGGGGGGIGGGGGRGASGNSVNAGGRLGGGLSPAASTAALGTTGGAGISSALLRLGAGGSGGGGGVIGGGGGGGGGDEHLASPGGGGGVAGGGGGGRGHLFLPLRSGGGGGGVGSVGNGADGLAGGKLVDYGSAGGGGGSYGGGGASGGFEDADSRGSGGGGGGSWTGGGSGGGGSSTWTNATGGSGNSPVGARIPDSAHYLNATNPRLMFGAAGGRGSTDQGSSPGGSGGGIVFLDFGTITGTGTITADGGAGVSPPSGIHSGSGGGGGGQVKITAAAQDTRITAVGGSGGRPSTAGGGAGVGGAGGGGGGVWVEAPGAPPSCGTTTTAGGFRAAVPGGTAPRVTNPNKRELTVGGGAGGQGLVCTTTGTAYALGNRVFRDANANGLQESDEPGEAGVAVTLLDAAGATVSSTTTSSNGGYVFDGLAAGTYRVRFGRPSSCAYAVPAVGTNRSTDSDAEPLTGVSGPVRLGPGQPDQRAVVGGDGVSLATVINPTLDAGLVCSTSSATTLGAYSSAVLTDYQPATAGPFDGATGTAVMSATPLSSSFLLRVNGIGSAAVGTTYGARLHFGRCVAGNPSAAGGTYNTDVLDGEDPPRIDPTTEVWLDLMVAANGSASATATVGFVPSAAERSIVIHAQPTDPDTGEVGPGLACLPVVIR